MLQRAAKNAYSWWWASHVRTKQSKWLDQNLQDMEEKVEYILKIIDEDGDTFRQRAEMYYQKRPEIINFVEDSFREYRALAERYDHLSRELQSANRTIAAVYPERFQLGIEDNDDFDQENLAATELTSDEFKKFSKNPPTAPKLPIPKVPNSAKKNAKLPSRLMSKKGMLKTNNAAVAAPTSVSKSEVLKRIDKLQKDILALQTEKEFVKSSYESGQEKYWDIEKQVTEMQVEVSNLEDEFGIGTVIEDDEARSLMTAAALKSCQDTLTLLQQKQKQSDEDARVELERIQQAREKFKTLKEELACDQEDQHEQFKENMPLILNVESDKLEQEVDSAEPNIENLETLRERLKEELQSKLGTSLTMSELAEKLDGLVDQVINLESAVSSQSAHVKQLRSEANELHACIQSLEEEKETLIEGSYNKVKELEEELQRAQSVSQRVKKQNNQLQTRFIQASFNLIDLSEKFLNVKPDEEAVDLTLSSQVTDILGATPVNQVRLHEMEHRNIEVKMLEQSACNVEKIKNPVQTIMNGMVLQEEATELNIRNSGNSEEHNDKSLFQPRQQHKTDEFPENRESAFRDENPLKWSSGSNSTSAPGYDIQIAENETTEDKGTKGDQAKCNATSIYGEGNVILSNQGNGLSYLPERGLNEQDDFILSNRDNHSDAHSVKGPVGNLPDANPEKSHVSTVSIVHVENLEMNCEEKRGQMFGHSAITLVERNNGRYQIEQSSNDFDNRRIEGPRAAVLSNGSEIRLKEQDNVTAPSHGLSNEKDMTVEAIKEDISLPNRENHSDDFSFKGHVDDLLDPNSAKFDERKDPVLLAENMEMKGEILRHSTIPLAAENNSRSQRLQSGDESGQPDVEMVESMKQQDVVPNQGKDHEPKKQNVILATEGNLNAHRDELGMEEEDDHPNWKELFMSGLDDREKILLKEYTSILRNYKEVRKKLNEVEKEKRASLFQYCIQIKVLRRANSVKDEKIQTLEKALNFLQGNQSGNLESKDLKSTATLRSSDDQSLNIDQVTLQDLLHKENFKTADTTEESNKLEQSKISNTKVAGGDESPKFSIIEEKIRTDIDELQEENIEFWMKFSNSFNQIQKFQNTVEDLQTEIAKLKKVEQLDGNANPRSHSSDIRPIYRHLREIHTELTLWLDHNAMLNDDLQNRLSSLSNVQEEIARFSNAGFRVEENELSDCQAAKFEGEVRNMKQENEKVADELQSGEKRVRILQAEIERTLKELDDEFDISVSIKNQKSRYTAVRSRIPLRSFLFGVKLKKQKPSSFLACMSPALQKQNSDLRDLQ